MQKRAEQMDETRQRIIESTVHLHGTLGPAHTTIAGIAREAGVTRLTVYRHFPDDEAIFEACSAYQAPTCAYRTRSSSGVRAANASASSAVPQNSSRYFMAHLHP